jgi:hypothetical protein
MKEAIFVFGSNLAGRHGAGAAFYARQNYGARNGQGEGLQGNSYAIPTKDENLVTLPLERISEHVERFKQFAREHPELQFSVTPVGCGLAGYSPDDIAPLFRGCPGNCILPDVFVKLLISEKEEK